MNIFLLYNIYYKENNDKSLNIFLCRKYFFKSSSHKTEKKQYRLTLFIIFRIFQCHWSLLIIRNMNLLPLGNFICSRIYIQHIKYYIHQILRTLNTTIELQTVNTTILFRCVLIHLRIAQ